MKTKSKPMNFSNAELCLQRVEAAIDAIVDLEGTVYHNGLPTAFSKTLAELRETARHYQNEINSD